VNLLESRNHARTARRILLVSENAQLRLLLRELLGTHGYHVVSSNGAVRERRSAVDWDAVIVDATASCRAVPWLRALETAAGVPTIAVTTATNAVASPLWDRVDAVVREPLDAHKLALIMRGLLAVRHRDTAGADCPLTKGPLTLHPLLNEATVAARQALLTDVETRVLRELMLAENAPVSRERLTRCALGRGWSPDDRSLDSHIKRLRRKLGLDRDGRTPIRTVRGVGYLLLEQWQPR
jgi:DNA-binding response OmpR family regulator